MGLGGRSPQNLRWGGTAHASFPLIFREVVLSDACKSANWVKKRCHQGIFCEIEVFLVKKGPYMLYITFQRVKTGKTEKIGSTTKKRSSEIFCQNENFFLKRSLKNFGSRNYFPSPQTRRQVSAYGPESIVMRQSIYNAHIFNATRPSSQNDCTCIIVAGVYYGPAVD